MTQHSLPKYFPRRNENINTCPHKDLFMNVSSSFIHNNPKLQTTQVSFNNG